MDEISLSYEQGELSATDVSELFVHFYDREQIEGLLLEWHQHGHVPHRLRILQSVIGAHIRGDFELSVPSILPQIEGVIADVFGHRGQMRLQHLKGYLDTAFARGSRFDRIGAAFIARHLLA